MFKCFGRNVMTHASIFYKAIDTICKEKIACLRQNTHWTGKNVVASEIRKSSFAMAVKG